MRTLRPTPQGGGAIRESFFQEFMATRQFNMTAAIPHVPALKSGAARVKGELASAAKESVRSLRFHSFGTFSQPIDSDDGLFVG